MNINILIEYCNKCRIYSWEGSWKGLKEYKKLKEKGYIKLWSA